jgi:glycosyltransferase involved in cell wall biosynthesis
MAAGCAAVATPIAASGLKDDTRQSLVLEDDEMHFADAVVTLLNDPVRREKLGKAAQAAVKRSYDWSELIPCLLKTYQDIGLG